MKGKGKRNNTRSKGKDHFTKRQRDVESVDMKADDRLPDRRDEKYDAHRAKPNDWRWYAQSPQLVKDYASYPFGNPLGNMLKTGIATLDEFAVPGIAVYQFTPTIGVASQPNDPINVAMRKVYSFVRHANSGAKNYDAPDLMMYLVAAGQCHMIHAWMKRIYGLMRDYTAFNRYYPMHLIYAMDVDFKSIQDNLNDFRGFINQYAVKLSQLWIPNSMSYMARQAWMCEGIYVDDPDSTKPQTYLYDPQRFYQFTLAGTPAVSALRYLDRNSYKHGEDSAGRSNRTNNFQDIVDMANDLINPLLANEDIGIMSGDILKAYGQGGIVQASTITEDYQVLPVYSQEVLSQLENTRAIQYGGNNVDGDVTQATDIGTGYLVSNPRVFIQFTGAPAGIVGEANQKAFADSMVRYIGNSFVLNFHNQSVNPEDVMVATRNIPVVDASSAKYRWYTVSGYNYTEISFNLTSCGSEIVNNIKICYLTESASGQIWLNNNSLHTVDIWGGGSSIDQMTSSYSAAMTRMARLAAFDWHPNVFSIVVTTTADGETSWSKVSALFQDMSNYTYLDNTNLENMHMTALLSEFSTPMIG